MRWGASVAVVAVAAAALVTAAHASEEARRCAPTPTDAFGPFGRGMPPLRSKIGTGHVLTGVVLSAAGCGPLKGAQVQFWQSNKDGQYTRAGSATVITDRDGRFRFEGPFPIAYESAPPHIHIRVLAKDHVALRTRYVPAEGERVGTIRLVLRPVDL